MDTRNQKKVKKFLFFKKVDIFPLCKSISQQRLQSFSHREGSFCLKFNFSKPSHIERVFYFSHYVSPSLLHNYDDKETAKAGRIKKCFLFPTPLSRPEAEFLFLIFFIMLSDSLSPRVLKV